MRSAFITLGLLLISSFASAWTMPHKVLVSVGDLSGNNSFTWKKEICAQVYVVANQVAGSAVDITCRSLDTTNFVDPGIAANRKDNEYHLRITRNYKGDIQMDVTNWRQYHPSDFSNLGWQFQDKQKGDATKEQAMTKTLANLFFYIDNSDAFKAGLLVNGASESNSIEYNQDKGIFLDKNTRDQLTIDQAYSLYEGESPRKKNYLRAGIELGVLFSSGMAIYYKNLVYNAQDFDYGFRDGIKKKLNGEAIRFDDNDKFANYGHVYAGVLYYNVARTNGASALESFLVSFASSATWEFLEYHEVFSINDQIMTPVGGYVIGEATYQISCALLQKDSKAAKALGYGINPVGAVNYGLNKLNTGDKFSSQPDCKKPRWSDVSVYLGLEKGQKPFKAGKDTAYLIGLDAKVVNLPDYQKPGSDSRVIMDTSMVRLIVENNGSDSLGDLKVIAQIVSAAYRQKDIREDAAGNLHGYDVIVGLGSATTWNDRGTKSGQPNEDYYGTINILGATAHATLFYKSFKITAEIGYYGDFAMVKSYAIGNVNDTEQLPVLNHQSTSLQKRGYYWGLGTSTLAAISAERGRVTIGYSAQISQATNINGKERNSEEITSPVEMKDSFMSHRFYVTFKLTRNLSFQLAHEIVERAGQLVGYASRNGTERRTMGTLVWRF